MILGNDFVKLKIVDSKKKRPLQAGLQYAKVTWRTIMDTGHASFGQMRQNYSSLATAAAYLPRKKEEAYNPKCRDASVNLQLGIS